MTPDFDRQALLDAISTVEHPEIAATLMALGMIRQIQYHEDEHAVSLVLLLPALSIPQQVRDYLLQSLYQVIQPFGLQFKVMLGEMDDEARAHFFQMSQAAWKAGGECAGCGSPN